MSAVSAEKENCSVRIPAQLKSRAANAAKTQHVSFNHFVTASIEKAVRDAEERALFDAFTELGSDSEMTDVSFAFEAQAEVALRD